MIEVAKIILEALFILFVPGFCLSFVLYEKKEIDIFERITLSFGLSIGLFVLIFLLLNLLGFRLSLAVVICIPVLIILTSCAILLLRKAKNH